jgi:hypothetical protein
MKIPSRSVPKVADRVPSRKLSPDIVTMHSQVLLADPGTGERCSSPAFPSSADRSHVPKLGDPLPLAA